MTRQRNSSEDFEKWITKHKSNFPQGVSPMDKYMFDLGWQASQENQAKRIEKLEYALTKITTLKSSTMNYGVAREIANKALATKPTEYNPFINEDK